MRAAVLAGGSSAEREVSLVSGRAVAQALIDAGYTIELLGVGPDDISFTRELIAPILASLSGGDPADASLPALAAQSGIVQYLRGVRVVVTTMHGTRGEDGVWQGVLELLGLPYVSAGVKGSALAMDKLISKRLFSQLGIPTPRYWVAEAGLACRVEIPAEITRLVAKPIAEGSSVGIAMVDNDSTGWARVAELVSEYGRMLIEERIDGRELTAGVIGHGDDPVALPLVEIRPKTRDFYDYTSKYTKGETDYIVPAPLDAAAAEAVQRHALTIFREFELMPYARIDCLLDADNVPWFLEANTLPGFTPLSLLPQAARAAGVDFTELLELLLLLAVERWEASRGGAR
ncbi:D-alanine--D-alanine ligase [bacterium]|nr:D-alanine--D-alanine ligase [bacterium]